MISIEDSTVLGLKVLGFAAMLLQLETLPGLDWSILQNGSIVVFLILGIRYFIGELKRKQDEFSQKWKEQEERHIDSLDKEKALHKTKEDALHLKIDTLQNELVELKIKMAKYES